MKLMIVESPGKTKKLREILSTIRPNENWRVEASVGHVRDLPAKGQGEGEITTGIRVDFTPIYELTERGREVISKLKRHVAEADEVYLATDPDREGESISWHLKDALGLKSPIRVAFNEITESKVREELSTPRKIDMKRVGAQEARRVLDRLVGYLVSAELRRQTGESLSAGRVQSVALYLVVLQERKIRAFKVTAHFGVRLNFAGAKSGEQWFAEWDVKAKSNGALGIQAPFVTDENPYFMDRRYAELVSRVRAVSVSSFDERDASRNPPAPFITSTLQQAASNSMGIDPDKTMQLAQALYEQGHISYHRTDNPNVSDESMADIRAVAKSLGLEVVDPRRKFAAKDGAQEGHPGITPTHWEVETAGETQEQRALYQLIRIRALASQLLAARYKVRTATLESVEPVEGKTIVFGAKGRTLIAPGWLKLLANDAADDDEQDEDARNPLPVLTPGEKISATDGQLLEKKTKAPPRFTQASLIKALESEGIGRPSTYGAIWANICARGYVGMADKRFIKPLPLGEVAIDRLEGKFAFLDVGFTRLMESELDRIAGGTTNYRNVVEQMYAGLAADLKAQQTAAATFRKPVEVFPCPECEKPLRFIAKGANGPFWGCTGHPACTVTLPDAKGKPGTRKVVELSSFACVQCGKALVHRTKNGKGGFDFWGCSGFKDGCKATYENVKGKPDLSGDKKSKSAK